MSIEYYNENAIKYLGGKQIKADISDINLYTKWSQNQITVSFNTDDGEAIPSITRYSKGYISALPVPKKEGEIFAGWYDNDSYEGKSLTSSLSFTDNVILYAKWIKGTIDPILIFSLKTDNTYEVYTDDSHSVKILIIPPYYQGKAVTTIKAHGFESSDFETLVIPDSVENIGDGAFYNNKSLTSLTLGSSLEQIGASAFEESAIKTLVIPDSVEKIWERAFYNNKFLTSLTLGSVLNYIGSEAFYNLKDSVFLIPKSVETINSNAFFSTIEKTINCQAISKPSGWFDDWYGNTNTTINWNTN